MPSSAKFATSTRRSTGAIVRILCLVGLVVTIAACEAAKWWKESRLSHATRVSEGRAKGWERTHISSAEGGIVVTQTRYGGRSCGVLSEGWRFTFDRPGTATSDRPVAFPHNLWIESWSTWDNPPPGTLRSTYRFLRIPWWPIIAAFGAYPTLHALRWARGRRYVSEGGCRECGYDLRHSPHRCPECGLAAGSAPAS